MKRLLLLLPLLLSACATWPANGASTLITATITITNAPITNGQTITVNSDTRTWTNSVSFPATQILTNNTITGCATNLYNAIADAPFLNLSLAPLTNGITLQSTPNGAMNVTLSAGWGSVVLSTNTLTAAAVVRVPLTVEYSTNQTNIATYLAQGLESSTYSVSQTAPFGSNWVNLGQAQTITGQKTIVSPVITNANILKSFLGSPISTNGINYGNAFSSPGTNANTEQFGALATASGAHAVAVGYNSYAPSSGSSSFGYQSQANGIQAVALGPSANAYADDGIALGYNASVNGTNGISIGPTATSPTGSAQAAIAIGWASEADQTNSVAIGYNSWSKHAYSVALGYNATTTAPNQIQLGTTAETVSIPGALVVGGNVSNITLSGTNNFAAGSDIAFGRFSLSTLANGNNAGVAVGTNVYCYLSGPTGAFTINGIAGGRNGKTLILVNRTGQNLTIANDSGVDATPANRIYCLTGADKTVTGNSAAILIYDSTLTHWIVLSFTQ